jgi:Na+/proline symporter
MALSKFISDCTPLINQPITPKTADGNKMKSTILMLSAIVTFILTWLLLTTVGYLLSDGLTFKEIASSAPVIMIMVVAGWVPSLIVCVDLDEKLD